MVPHNRFQEKSVLLSEIGLLGKVRCTSLDELERGMVLPFSDNNMCK